MDWVVRTATVADADAIGQLHVRSWRHGYRGVVPDSVLAGLDPEERAERWRETLGSPGEHRVFLAVRAGFFGPELGAFCGVGPVREPERDGRPGERTGELYALYAAPEAFGRGAAAVAHRAGLRRLHEAGHPRAVLWVLTENPRARAFYERHGWRCDELVEEHEFHGVGMPVVRYSCEPGDASVTSSGASPSSG